MGLLQRGEFKVLPEDIKKFLIDVLESCNTLEQLEHAYYWAVRPPGFQIGEEEVDLFYSTMNDVKFRINSRVNVGKDE